MPFQFSYAYNNENMQQTSIKEILNDFIPVKLKIWSLGNEPDTGIF